MRCSLDDTHTRKAAEVTETPDGRLIIGRETEPFEAAVLAMSLLYGLLGTFKYDLAATSIRMYPWYGGRIFLVLLALGALVGLMGLLNRSRWGMRLEGAGLSLLSILGLAYAIWTPFSVGTRGFGLILFLGILLFAPSLVLALRLRRYLKRVEALEGKQSDRSDRPDGARPEAT